MKSTALDVEPVTSSVLLYGIRVHEYDVPSVRVVDGVIEQVPDPTAQPKSLVLYWVLIRVDVPSVTTKV